MGPGGADVVLYMVMEGRRPGVWRGSRQSGDTWAIYFVQGLVRASPGLSLLGPRTWSGLTPGTALTGLKQSRMSSLCVRSLRIRTEGCHSICGASAKRSSGSEESLRLAVELPGGSTWEYVGTSACSKSQRAVTGGAFRVCPGGTCAL